MTSVAMIDDAYSEYVRQVKGNLHPDWRVFKWECVGSDDSPMIQMVGALARPATEHDSRAIGEPVWFNPLKGRAQITISQEKHDELCVENMARREAARLKMKTENQ